MRTYSFSPRYGVVAEMPGRVTIEEMERERGVYSATPEFVRKHCGPVACRMLDAVPDAYYALARELKLWVNIDVRIHRLYPGDFPAFPGWHCDGEYRETYFSQPDMDRIQVHQHLTGTISTAEEGISNTQFLDQPLICDLEHPTADHTLWGQVHRHIEGMPNKRLFDTKDGQMIQFDSWTLHRAMPAKVRGWRLFFRMSMWHRPNLGEGGMLTRQEQVYQLVEGTGW